MVKLPKNYIYSLIQDRFYLLNNFSRALDELNSTKAPSGSIEVQMMALNALDRKIINDANLSHIDRNEIWMKSSRIDACKSNL